MFVAKVTIADKATPALKVLFGLAGNKRDFITVLGRRGANELRNWFHRLNATKPNKKGWPRQNFWSTVANSVSQRPKIAGDSATISINHPVIAHKAGLGPMKGHIRPRNKKWLTIPAVPEAYGKSAKEYQKGGGKDHKLFFIKRGESLAFLAEIDLSQKNEQEQPKSGKRGKSKQRSKLKIIYILKKHVYQKPDPDALPDVITWQNALVDEASKFVSAEIEKKLDRTE